jgi:DNA replication and repair protein RecF
VNIEWLSLDGFRSYGEFRWEPSPEINVLVGRNGAGKTNLLEAIAYAATLKSFRGAPDEALVGFGRDAAFLRSSVRSEDASSLIEIEIRRRGGRRALVNRQRLARSADLLGHIRMVTFLPEDLDIVKRGPALRRGFLDEVAVQLWPASHVEQGELERAVRQRNAFLKQGANDEMTLGVWDERLAMAGGKVMTRRARAMSALVPHLVDAHREVAESDAEVGMEYGSEWGGGLDPATPASEFADRLRSALERNRKVDRDRRVTTAGPHRDEPVLVLGGHDARFHASQGEQRTLSLALRVASHRAITESTGTAPVLLLDDVYSELDPGRGAALTGALPVAQTLVTTAHPGDVPLQGAVWSVGGGEVWRS